MDDANQNALVLYEDRTNPLVVFQSAPAPEADDTFQVLIIEGDTPQAEQIAESLPHENYNCTIASSGDFGRQLIETEVFDIILTDLMSENVNGIEVLQHAREELPEAQVILLAEHGSIESAVAAMHFGAFYYLQKPFDLNKLRLVVDHAARAILQDRRPAISPFSEVKPEGFGEILGHSPAMQQMITRLQRIAPQDVSVLILGETGTGKDLIARTIHENSKRRSKKFVALNCAELNSQILESELFGHVKGSYTGATGDRQGRFEYADGGTLFLDEIGDMPKEVQVKLLRVLESGQITRMGSNQTIKINVRVLAATNVDLEKSVAEGTFREDLYHRIKTIPIHVPPLRERGDDLKLLMDFFIQKFAQQYNRKIKGITGRARRRLMGYHWPGNVRELMQVLTYMIVLGPSEGLLDDDDLPPNIQGHSALPSAQAKLNGYANLVGKTMDEIERIAIEETLRATGGNREEAAKMLDIGQRTIYRKLEKYQKQDRGEE